MRGEMLIFYETTNIIEATEKKTYQKILGTRGMLTEEKTQIEGVGYITQVQWRFLISKTPIALKELKKLICRDVG